MEGTALETMRRGWTSAVGALGGDELQAASAFEEILQRHAESWRHYHTLEHVFEVWQGVRQLLGDRPSAVPELSAFLHDVVYEPRASDNEERSAALARDLLGRLGVPPEAREACARLILLTRTHEVEDGDEQGCALLDADLAILGAEPIVYDRYAAAIREEYAWVPEPDYRQGRGQILERFLKRPVLYHTVRMRQDRELQARANLEREIAWLARQDESP